ncbi:MAG: PP2C family protein-serine/threonine phosphatase [Nevskiaceae bacterium]
MSVRAAGGQVQGTRKRQEDAFAVERYGPAEVLALVADGLGGHPAGDVASHEAVREFVEQFGQRRTAAAATPRQWLQEAALATHQSLLAMVRAQRHLREMATTLVALYLRGAEFWAVSVGDSYLLLLREGRLMRLNELHTEDGGVTSCVGFNLSRVDVADALAVKPGDRFLLASDGIVTLDDAEVSAFLGAGDAEAAVHGMLAAVEQAQLPNQDNATAVAVLA